ISIESAGFLGDSYVAITPPKVPSATYLENGEVVVGAPSIGLNALANSAGDISERGKEIVVDMRAALSELNSALSKLDSSILGEENLALFNETIAGLSEAVENLNTDVLGEENSENLRVSLANFRKISENFVTTSENLIASSEKISPILDTAQGAVEKADEGIGEITSAARNAKVAIKQATEGDGLVAALINDAELRNDFEALISNLRSSGILRYRDTVAEPLDKPRLGERKGIFRNR
ncbi:MAG: MlaD family protein, partial [Verrucomicrobiales bacterium]